MFDIPTIQDSDPATPSSLTPAAWAAATVELIKGSPNGRLIILCDHAGAEVPGGWASLGVDEGERRRHIALDIGAATVTRRMAQLLDATAVLNHSSRLYVDANRRPLSVSSIPEVSDGTLVPANHGLSSRARARRHRLSFWPYHRQVARLLGGVLAKGAVPIILSVHSFTPNLAGLSRPWDIGILHDRDRRLSDPIIETLKRPGDLLIGDNEPYSGLDAFGYTIGFHAQRTGFPHLMFELRQDRVACDASAKRHGDLMACAVAPTLNDAALNQCQPDGRPTYQMGPLGVAVF